MFYSPGGFDMEEKDSRKKIQVHQNGDFENGRTLYVEPDWDIDALLNAATERLSLFPAAARIFDSDGGELDDVMMVEDNEILFVSSGTDFVAPALTEPPPGDGPHDDEDTSHLPAVIAGYKVGAFLGRGGFGEVRLGVHQLSNEDAALKLLPKSAIASMGAAERTTTEIQCLTALRHPNIIRLLQQCESQHHVVLVFELMKGGDLFQHLCTLKDQRLPEDEARAVFHQVLSGVGYAHNHHICHRDLKLDNILLTEQGLAHVKVADFGLSEFYRPGAVMRSNCGSLSYLAPEVFRGTSNAGPPLDVWSLGVILFGLLCGRLPFEGKDLNGSSRPREAVIRNRICKCQYKMDEHLSPDAKDLVRRMLKMDPGERASIPEVFNHGWLRNRGPTCPPHLNSHSRSNSTSSERTPRSPRFGGSGGGASDGIFGQGSGTGGTTPRSRTSSGGEVEGRLTDGFHLDGDDQLTQGELDSLRRHLATPKSRNASRSPGAKPRTPGSFSDSTERGERGSGMRGRNSSRTAIDAPEPGTKNRDLDPLLLDAKDLASSDFDRPLGARFERSGADRNTLERTSQGFDRPLDRRVDLRGSGRRVLGIDILAADSTSTGPGEQRLASERLRRPGSGGSIGARDLPALASSPTHPLNGTGGRTQATSPNLVPSLGVSPMGTSPIGAMGSMNIGIGARHTWGSFNGRSDRPSSRAMIDRSHSDVSEVKDSGRDRISSEEI